MVVTGPIYPPVRTFHARHGRLSATLRTALRDAVPGVDVANLPAPVDLGALLPGNRVVVDFGAGMGHHALQVAATGACVLAIDVHSPGIARLALSESPRVLVHHGDGVALLRDHLAPSSVDEVHILFPDPWPKARHAKRRLLQPGFLSVVDRVLRPGGLLAVVTDHDGYATHIEQVVAVDPRFRRTDEVFDWEPTRYHERALRLGNAVRVFTLR